ncbi:MAG: site-specific integrase [Bryobacteraceae bacterium]|jgi:site-specific recombinase XerD
MPLTVYRRHRSKCKKADDRYWKKCRCACWCEGTVEGAYTRQSLKTRSWERAVELAREFEDGKRNPTPSRSSRPLQSFLADAERGRKLRPATIKKYNVVLGQLKVYTAEKGVVILTHITVDFMRGFRASWQDGAISSVKKLERMRAFFRHFVLSGSLQSNPATVVMAPVVKQCPTLPLSDKEIAKALEKAEDPRWHALIQVLRWSGLRIGDAMKLTQDKFDSNRLFLRTAKTGTPVYLPMPPAVMEELKNLPLYGGYYFWNRAGESKIETATGNARRAFRRIFNSAGIKNAHPHRLRDSFAVGLLEKGVPIENVSILLGHSDIRITQRHYSPWVRSLQANLEKAVASAWDKPKLVRVK